MRSRLRAWFIAAAFSSPIVSIGPASAEPPAKRQPSTEVPGPSQVTAAAIRDREHAAQDAFQLGRELSRQGKFDEACAKFERSLRLSEGVGTLYNLADCEEKRGRFARAQRLFSQVAEKSRILAQTEREQAALDRAFALNSKVSLLQIEFEDTSASLFLDGEPVDPDAASALPVDPGMHRLSASSRGKRSWFKNLNVPKPGLLFVVSVPALQDSAGSSKRSFAGRADNAAKRSRQKRAARRPPAPVQKGSVAAERAALALLAAGTGGLVMGTAFGLQYLSNDSDARETCPTSLRCSPEEVAAHAQFLSTAKKARGYSYIGFGGGTAALVGAAVLHFTIGRDRTVEARTGMNPDGSFSASVRARF